MKIVVACVILAVLCSAAFAQEPGVAFIPPVHPIAAEPRPDEFAKPRASKLGAVAHFVGVGAHVAGIERDVASTKRGIALGAIERNPFFRVDDGRGVRYGWYRAASYAGIAWSTFQWWRHRRDWRAGLVTGAANGAAAALRHTAANHNNRVTRKLLDSASGER